MVTQSEREVSGATEAAKMRPKEHGAYAILAIPTLTSLCISGVHVAGLCIAIAAATGFLANEPLLVAWGQRGKRAQRSSPSALGRLLALLSITVFCGLVAVVISETPARIGLIACFASAVLTFACAAQGFHRTLWFQLLAIVGLTLPSVVILLSGGISLRHAMMFWGVWLVGFPSTTVAVRSVIAAQKRQSRRFGDAILIPVTLVLVVGPLLHFDWTLPAIPMVVASWYLRIAPPPAKYLKRVGWALVLSTMVTAGWTVIWMLRTIPLQPG
jgi:hypothetical protein